MNLPKSVKMYCSKCKAHTEHKLKEFKAASPRTMAWGTRQNLRKHKQGYGGKAEFPKKPKKQNKNPTFVAECNKCHSKRYKVLRSRMKKAELVAKE
ncbi:MAG: 50S ribosomal protein L44e [Candidatus Diapherotrites archaeon]